MSFIANFLNLSLILMGLVYLKNIFDKSFPNLKRQAVFPYLEEWFEVAS